MVNNCILWMNTSTNQLCKLSAVNIRFMRVLVGFQAEFHIGLSGCSLQYTVYQ